MAVFLKRFGLILTLLSAFTLFANANHIVGGELQMRPTGNAGTFEVTLIQFWDQNNLVNPSPTSNGNRDVAATLYIYGKKDKKLLDSVEVRYDGIASLLYQNKACANSRSLNTSIGTYTGTIALNASKYSDPEGYYMVWERCCRNDDINNIVAPGDNGMVFYLEFPPLSVGNSSPQFIAPNGQYICSNRRFSMNMSATDANGDQLIYSLVTPIRGTTNPNRPFGNSSQKTGYPLVTWEAGISNSNMIPGSSPLQVSSTGILTVTASNIGLYVFTVQCEEYRNGKKIGLVRRDFQLLVIDCNDDQPEQPVIKLLAQPVTEVLFCPEKPVTLETDDSEDWAYQWQFNGLNIQGENKSSIVVKDSGQYAVVKSYTKKCSRDTSSSVVHVGYANPVQAVISVDKSVLCEGEILTLLANSGKLASGETLTWSMDNVLLSDAGTSLNVTSPGSYRLQVISANFGCSGADTAVISKEIITASLPARKGVGESSRILLSPVITPPTGNYTYEWSPPEGIESPLNEPSAIVSPAQETMYYFKVTSENGCSAQDSILVYVIDKMHIPNTFSPNRDGHNDTFEIFNAKDQILEMRIYNRWGQVVFESSGYDNPWDGTYKEAPVPAGEYPYIIKTSERQFNGTIMVLR